MLVMDVRFSVKMLHRQLVVNSIKEKKMKMNTMKKTIIALAVLSTTAYGASLEDRVEDLELSRDLNTWTFSGELEARYDYFDVENTTQNQNYSEDQYSLWARFDMHSKRSDKLDFYGRLAMSKYFNDFTTRSSSLPSTVTASGSAGRDKSGAEMYVERAFINYKVSNALTFTIGRLPTIEGPSYHLQKGTARSGTYPQLAYGAELDGMALTYGVKALGGTLALRAIYTPLDQVNNAGTAIDSRYLGTGGLKVGSTEQMYSGMIDYEKLNLGWTNRLNFIGQYVGFNDFYLDFVNPTNGQTISNLNFDYSAFVAYLELNGVANTGLDLGFTFKRSTVDSRGKIALSGLGQSDVGVFTNGTDGKNSGNVIMVDARYTLGKLKVGYEFLKADDYAFQIGLADVDAMGFYSTPASTGHHLFTSYDMNSDMRLILGYMMQTRDKLYSNGVLGAGADVEKKVNGGYARLITNF